SSCWRSGCRCARPRSRTIAAGRSEIARIGGASVDFPPPASPVATTIQGEIMRTIFISVIAALLLAALPVAAQKAPQNATQFYMEYHDAWVKAKSMDTLLPYMDKTSRGQYDATPKEQRGPMFQMMKGMGG